MMKRILLLYITLILVTSCKRDSLYYGTNHRAVIRTSIDWKASQLSPNGVSVIAYNEDGTLFEVLPPFSNPNEADIMLPEGVFHLVFHNNTPDEQRNIAFRGYENMHTLEAYAIDAKPSAKAMEGHANDLFVSEPDTLAVAKYTALKVTADMIGYYKDRPDLDNQLVSQKIAVTPQRVISVAEIKAHVKGLRYAAGAPRTYLRNVSGAHFMWKGEKSKESVSHEFVLNNRKFDAGSNTDGTITKNLTTFGLHTAPSSDHKYYLDLDFTLINGEKHPISIDITDEIILVKAAHSVLKINVELELPEVIGGGGEGAFDPDVDEWDDINVELPI